MKKKIVTKNKKNSSNKQKSNSISDPTSLFFLSFVGEWVEIICKLTTTTEIGHFPLVAMGFVLDVDNEHIFLSDDGQNVSRAVKRSEYVLIDIAKQETELERKLNTVTIPNTPDEGN